MASAETGLAGSTGSVEYLRRLLIRDDDRDSESVPSPFTLRLGCSDWIPLASAVGAGVAGTTKPGRLGKVALRGKFGNDVDGSVALRPSAG